ncbi:MAG: hypothetical protein GY951_08035 [Psychromonas sp.]|nr:hypothetical protein [Alteromonadales bacterium]MCP5077989.1 hypothetical protein [Psychromonas sp.]
MLVQLTTSNNSTPLSMQSISAQGAFELLKTLVPLLEILIDNNVIR